MQSNSLYIIYSRILALLLFCCSTMAQAQLHLGYCTDEVGNSGVTNSNAGATVSCAIALTPQQWDEYSFCDLSGARIGLYATTDVSQVKVWVRESLKGPDLVSATLDSTQFVPGWNHVSWDTSLSFAGHDTLYIGYDYTQLKGKLKVIAASGAKKTANSFWLGVNGKWNDQNSKYAPLCIQAELSSRYSHAVSMNGLRLLKRSILNDKEDNTVFGTVRNLGSLPLNSFEIVYADSTFKTETLHFDLPALVFGQSAEFQFDFQCAAPYGCFSPDIPLTIHIDQPNDLPNEYQSQADVTLFYEKGQLDPIPANRILIEEFTSLNNGYAPLGSQRLRDSFEEVHRILLGDNYDYRNELDGYNTEFFVLSRHQGYGPADALCVTEGSDYQPTWFGPDQLTFAPAVWANRKDCPISTTQPVDSIAHYIAESHQLQWMRTEVQDIVYDETTRELSANVLCSIFSMGMMKDPRVMCVVAMDSIYAPQKDYYEFTGADIHQNTVVAYMQPSQQQMLPWTNREAIMAGQARLTDQGATPDEYGMGYVISHHFSCTLKPNFDALDKMTIITYIYDAADEGFTCGVNSAKVKRAE